MLIVIGKAGQEHHRWPHVHMVSEEIARLGHTQIPHAGTCDTDERARDLRLDVAMVPGVSGVDHPQVATRRLEIKIRIAEEGESRLTQGNPGWWDSDPPGYPCGAAFAPLDRPALPGDPVPDPRRSGSRSCPYADSLHSGRPLCVRALAPRDRSGPAVRDEGGSRIVV